MFPYEHAENTRLNLRTPYAWPGLLCKKFPIDGRPRIWYSVCGGSMKKCPWSLILLYNFIAAVIGAAVHFHFYGLAAFEFSLGLFATFLGLRFPEDSSNV